MAAMTNVDRRRRLTNEMHSNIRVFVALSPCSKIDPGDGLCTANEGIQPRLAVLSGLVVNSCIADVGKHHLDRGNYHDENRLGCWIVKWVSCQDT